MILLDNRARGMTFAEWQDAIHETPHGGTIGNFNRDLLSIPDVEYLRMELSTRNCCEDDTPDLIKKSRGVGKWLRPKVAIVILNISTTVGRNNPKWEGFKKYKRLRPFSGSKVERDMLYQLLRTADLPSPEVYVMVADKVWLPETSAIALFQAELETIHAEKVVCDGPEAYQFTKQYGTSACRILPKVVAKAKDYREAAQERREIFRQIVRG